MNRIAPRFGQFESAIRADVARRRWLHVHAFLLGTICFLTGWAISAGLMHGGVERLWLRWAIALALTYLIYLAILRVWCGWLLSHEEGELPGDAIDALMPKGHMTSTGSAAEPAGPAPFNSAGGGDFGGGGASASFDTGDGGGLGDVASGALEVAAGADEGIVVVVPLAVVIGVGAAIAGALGFAVFGLFGVEMLLGVVVEIAFAAAGGALAFRARREGWLEHAASRSAAPMLALLLMCVAVGAAIDHWLPEANSLPQAIRALTQ